MAAPVLRLGAAAPGVLALPSAQPAADTLYAPRGVFWSDRSCVVADSGNHRVLIWHERPTQAGQPADVVLGQPTMEAEGPRAGETDPRRGLHLPCGVAVIDGRLVVADAWNHRLLIWDTLPQEDFAAPDHVLGQPTAESVEANAGGEPTAQTLHWPYGFDLVGGVFWVADTGNRRVLGWDGLPEPGQPARYLLGQDDAQTRDENRGREVGHGTYRWPHDVTGDAGRLLVADAGDHRIVGWDGHPVPERDFDLVLGQDDVTTGSEWPYAAPGDRATRFPYAISFDGEVPGGGRLAAADTANNRVLVWDDLPRHGLGAPATRVLGQRDFDGAGENRWDAIRDDTLCWPYGLHLCGDALAIADSGNNRVVVWDLAAEAPPAPDGSEAASLLRGAGPAVLT
ncbi:MAG: NHL repeat-containing protein [Bacteroidota bacterium]